MTRKQKIQDLIDATKECIVDLKHYVATHGPGPDQRLANLQSKIEEMEKFIGKMENFHDQMKD